MNGVYPDLTFPPAPTDRPYVVVNMVATLDGKILGGGPEGPVGLGSETDQATMRQIERAVDGIMIGHGTLKATPKLWFPAAKHRYVVSGSGDVDRSGRFFTDAPDRAYVVTTRAVPNAVGNVGPELDWPETLRQIRESHGIQTLLVEGGSQLNASLMSRDLVDELFLTLAPKIKLGSRVPTIAGGEPLDRDHLQSYSLLSHLAVGDELFLRYRRVRSA